MTKDFKASQVRTTQIIASGSASGKPALMIVSASSPGVDYDGGGINNATTLAGVGRDVFIFVSGTKSSKNSTSVQGVTVFGGDIVVSGTAYDSNGNTFGSTSPGGSTTQVQFNDAGSFAGDSGFTYNKITDTISVGSFYATGTTANNWISGSLTVAGNLTIKGTTTSVSSSNLTIADPIVYIASGSVGTDTKSAIAFASGSSVTNQSLIFGVVGSGNVLAAAKQDVQSGSLAQSSLSFSDLVPLRASSYQIGGSAAALTSSDGQNVVLYSGGGGFINLAPGSTGLKIGNNGAPFAVTGSDVRFGTTSAQFANEIPPQPGADSYFFVSGSMGSKSTSTRGTSVFGGDVVISGTLHGGSPLKVGDNLLVTGAIYLKERDSVPTVAGDEAVIYSFIDGSTAKLYWKNGDGVQREIGTGGASSGTFNEPGPAEFVTTASVSIAGGRGFGYTADAVGADTFFFVSGSIGSKNTSTKGTSVFGGDVVLSGSLHGDDNRIFVTSSIAALATDRTGLSLRQGNTDASITLSGSLNNPGLFGDSVSRPYITTETTNQNIAFVLKGGTNTRVEFIPDDDVKVKAFISGSGYISGTTVQANALSGSLTKLKDGTSYLIAGDNVTITTGSNGAVTIASTGGGGGGSGDANATYLVLSATGSLNNERVITAGTGISTTDGGAGGNYTIAISDSVVATVSGTTFTGVIKANAGLSGSLTKLTDGSSYLIAGSNVTITTGSNGAVTIASTGGGGGGSGDSDATYLVLSATGSLNNERVITAGTGISTTDGGAGENYTISINDSVVATVSGTTFTGVVKANSGLSGSLTQLTDGTSYLKNGTGILVTTASNGSVSVGINNSVVATVSGTTFTGIVKANSGFSGSLTQLTDGTSYLIAGSNVTITTGTNGAITIASTAPGTPGGANTQVQFNDGGSFGGNSGLTYNKTTNTLSVGNLIVTGTTTTVSSTNLVISDQVIYFGSGSTTSNTNGGIALASGSAVANQALVFGRVANNTWGAGRQDVVSGTTTDLTSMILVPMRASSFELGGSTAYVSSSDGTNIILSGSTTVSGTLTATLGLSGSLTKLKDGTSYLIGGTGISMTTGSSGAITAAILNSVVATVSGTTFTGAVKANSGLSGSLTKLTDGTSYLVAGTNVTITTGSNGAVTIASTGGGGGGDSFFSSTTNASIFTTGSVAIRGGESSVDSPSDKGSDVFFYVSGTQQQKNTANGKTSVFGGDVVVSGVLHGGQSSFTNNTLLNLNANNIVLYGGPVQQEATRNDISLFVSGAIGSKDGANRGTAVFGGDVVISGTLHGGSPLKIAGGMQLTGTLDIANDSNSKITVTAISGSLTKLTDGTSYLIAGSNVTITTGSNGAVTIASTGGGGGGSGDANATYLVLSATGSLNNERVITAGTGISTNDAGAGGNYTISINDSVVATVSGTTFTGGVYLSDLFVSGNARLGNSPTDNLIVSSTSYFGRSIDVGAQNLGINSSEPVTGSLIVRGGPNAPAFFGAGNQTVHLIGTGTNGSGAGIIFGDYLGSQFACGIMEDVDDGLLIKSLQRISLISNQAGVGINTTNPAFGYALHVSGAARVDTLLHVGGGDNTSDTNFGVSGSIGSKGTAVRGTATFGGDLVSSGVAYFERGLSGSLTKLTDGTSYLIAGNNVTITTGSSGAVTIASTGGGGGGDSFFTSTTQFSIFTTGSTAFVGTEAGIDSPQDKGADIFFYVSGSKSSKDGATPGVSMFGGDLMLSGSTYVASGSSILPVVDRGSDLGSASKRWGNVYTGDLHLRNDRGDWTIVEEEDYLCVVNNKTGKKFKMALIPLEE